MPVENVFTRSFRRSRRPKYFSRFSARSFHSERLWSFAWSQRFSQAVKSSSRITSDATQPMRCFTCIGSRRTLNPATDASPSVMSVSPVSSLIIVVLPAPFGPRSPKTVPSATFRLTWSTAVSFPYTLVRFSVTIALLTMEHLPSLRENPQHFLSHVNHHTAEFVRLLRGHVAHVRPEELARRPELSEERGPLRPDRGLEGAKPGLDLLAAAPKVRLAFARDAVRLAPFLAAHGQVSLAHEGLQGRVDGPGARLVEPVVASLDVLDDLIPMHRTFFEQVEDQTLEVALAEEVEEPAELLGGAHEDSSRRRNHRMASTPPTIAYARKTSTEVAGSGTNPTLASPPGPGRTAPPPSTFEMIPDAEVGMNQGSTFATGRIAPTMLKISVKRKNVKTVAATVLLKIAEMRYATPTTHIM